MVNTIFTYIDDCKHVLKRHISEKQENGPIYIHNAVLVNDLTVINRT